ncbi:uncharacterized protein LOC127833398 [Dreissena polymorpha]|uniref:uncharacterized protein LOC127833398 n=1 Tax=Dreissena polymorpha TaxID=45954 RepID=UPI002264F5E1|nr:uncharacterized protein LOC127833398 [Dreissena polymorpha]
MHIDAVLLHGSLYKSYKIEMGLTQGLYETEGIMDLSTLSPATWSPSNNGPYRYARIQANPQTETLKLCEVLVKGQNQPRTPYFRLVTGIAMSNHPISTVFNVLSNIECVFVCLRQTEPACLTSQFDQATQSCKLFGGFEHIKNASNDDKTAVYEFAAHFFANKN